MPSYFVGETFFRPPEHTREQSALPARIYNTLQLLIGRHNSESRFVPIRSMQYQAVIERDEIIFVDSQGGYAYQDGEGGRLILIAWRPAPPAERASLDRPVPCEIVYYSPHLKETQRRLMSEFPPVLEDALRRQRDERAPAVERRIVPFRRGA